MTSTDRTTAEGTSADAEPSKAKTSGVDRSEAELIADAVRAVPGVSGLHAGAMGEAVTLLPGRRVAGIKVTDEGSEVHIAVEHGHPVREIAQAVRQATRGVVDRPVTVVVEDIAMPDAEPTEQTPAHEPEGPASLESPEDPEPSDSPAPETHTTTANDTTSAPSGAKERN